jgi:hypothetical protein
VDVGVARILHRGDRRAHPRPRHDHVPDYAHAHLPHLRH